MSKLSSPMSTIETVRAMEILDSRGRPTVQATCRLAGGCEGTASVPSGASTGLAEALELRDGDAKRYRGLGCLRAVANVNNHLQQVLVGHVFKDQEGLDRAVIEIDGTQNKPRLGANAILAASLAFARAVAVKNGTPLYRYFADCLGQPAKTLPRPAINL